MEIPSSTIVIWILGSILSLSTAISSIAAVFIAKKFSALEESIDELNRSVAKILERSEWHTKTLNDHGGKINNNSDNISDIRDRITAIEQGAAT